MQQYYNQRLPLDTQLALAAIPTTAHQITFALAQSTD